MTKDITGENGELTMQTLQTELNNEFVGKTVTITPSADNKEWTIKVDDVEVTVSAGKDSTPQVASKLTDDEKTALQTNGIAEITGDDILNEHLKDNSRIKAVITGEVPLTTEMSYVTGTKDTGVVVSIDGNEFVWVPVPVAIASSIPSTTGADLAANPETERPMAMLQSGSETNYQGVLYDFSGTTSTYQSTYDIEPAELEYYDDDSSYDVIDSDHGIILSSLQTEYNYMVASVAKYGGFYVGRYELGLDGTNPVSKPASNTVTTADAVNSNTSSWYGLYSKCKNFSATNLTSTMMWGSQYDAMMNWMAKTGKTVGTADNEKYNHEQTTGSKEEDIINNVKDLYGCHFEWTLEILGARSRVHRGGSYIYSYSPSVRYNDYPYSTFDYYGSRLSLYIK